MPIPPREVGKVSTVGNQAASGTLSPATVDTDVRAITVAQTTAGVTLALPAPTDASVVFGVDVINVGTAAFTMYGETVQPLSLARFGWYGTGWASEGGSSANLVSATQLSVALPNGSVHKSGQGTSNSGGVATVTFSAAFPTACVSVTATVATGSATTNNNYSVNVVSFSKTGFTLQINDLVTALLVLNAVGGVASSFHWQADGY